MLKYVLRDGFDACEEDVQENLQGDAEFSAGNSISHRDAMTRARATIAAHARRPPKQSSRKSSAQSR